MNFRGLQDMVMNAAERYANREIVKTHLNERYQHLCRATRCNRTSATVTLPTSTSGDYDIALDLGLDDVAAIRHVSWTGSGSVNPLPVEATTTDEIINLRMALPSSGWVRAYAFDPPSTLSLYPGGGSPDTITIYYLARPAEMDQDEDEPTLIPAEFHRVVAYGAIADAAVKDARVWTAWQQRYDQGVRELRGHINLSDSATPQQMTQAARWPIYHDRSTDIGA